MNAEGLRAIVERHCGKSDPPRRHDLLGGGCINEAFAIETASGRRYFAKANRADRLPMFEAEAAGLEELAKPRAIRVPTPLGCGIEGSEAYLLLEYIDFGGRGFAAEMGRQLAALHRQSADAYGWRRNNTIGTTPQANPWTGNWITFFREHRLRPLFDALTKSGNRVAGGDRLLQNMDTLFEDYDPPPSLLHGDLWGGNAGYDREGRPVIFDPAVYYGDREADLALTELFGGFGSDFYRAYDEAWPIHPGYRRRKTLYNLYHILNHALLFGSGYAGQAASMVRELVGGR